MVTRSDDTRDDGRYELLHFRCEMCGDKVYCRADEDDYYPHCSKACKARAEVDTLLSNGVSERDIYAWR